MEFVWLRAPDDGERCSRCDRELKSECVMLELDRRDNSYHQRGDVPPDQSQGWFPFGKDCAERILGA